MAAAPSTSVTLSQENEVRLVEAIACVARLPSVGFLLTSAPSRSCGSTPAITESDEGKSSVASRLHDEGAETSLACTVASPLPVAVLWAAAAARKL